MYPQRVMTTTATLTLNIAVVSLWGPTIRLSSTRRSARAASLFAMTTICQSFRISNPPIVMAEGCQQSATNTASWRTVRLLRSLQTQPVASSRRRSALRGA